ncbi:hypothetical protein F4820DRAFT_61979 [Hypoxylon rubiginosum]|uniref:Uncharacterized protein n=1 Tax=Hypoxylon rubiginosum TaxID=110542 RepID=A0ACB9ZC00_9PEZI|nr:hypothetical protein F4820DRAFT_61979 [Hypoxylon rubiginosum]
MTVITKKILLLVTLLSTSMALDPHEPRQPVSDELRDRQDGMEAICYGGDYYDCIASLSEQCSLSVDEDCSSHNSQLCACWCSCDQDECDVVLEPVPNYCH